MWDGDDHFIMYRAFLEFLGFKLIYRTFIRCLQLTKNNLTIETPLFNKINNQKIFIDTDLTISNYSSLYNRYVGVIDRSTYPHLSGGLFKILNSNDIQYLQKPITPIVSKKSLIYTPELEEEKRRIIIDIRLKIEEYKNSYDRGEPMSIILEEPTSPKRRREDSSILEPTSPKRRREENLKILNLKILNLKILNLKIENLKVENLKV